MKQLNYLKRLYLLPVLLLLAGTIPALAQPLSGTYTVGGTSPSYPTLAAAAADLNLKGVSAPVIFDIRDGVYTNDQALINQITGASSVNRITFKSESGTAANVVINYTSAAAATN